MNVRTATLADLLAHLRLRKSPLTAADYGLHVAEAQAGRVLALNSDGLPVALGGVFRPDAGGPATCWFSVLPGSLARSLAAVAVLMRNLLVALAPSFPEGLAAYVLDDNAHGARLATALGFRPTTVSIGALRRWVYVGRTEWTNRPSPAGAGPRSAGLTAG